MRISSDIWVAALIRRVELAGAFATVVIKGDARAGEVLVKAIDRRTGRCQLFSGAQNADGERIWIKPTSAAMETEIDAYVARARKFDPDIWLVEIEDADGRRFLTETVAGD